MLLPLLFSISITIPFNLCNSLLLLHSLFHILSTFNSFLNSNFKQNVENGVSIVKHYRENWLQNLQKILRPLSFWSTMAKLFVFVVSIVMMHFLAICFFVSLLLSAAFLSATTSSPKYSGIFIERNKWTHIWKSDFSTTIVHSINIRYIRPNSLLAQNKWFILNESQFFCLWVMV